MKKAFTVLLAFIMVLGMLPATAAFDDDGRAGDKAIRIEPGEIISRQNTTGNFYTEMYYVFTMPYNGVVHFTLSGHGDLDFYDPFYAGSGNIFGTGRNRGTSSGSGGERTASWGISAGEYIIRLYGMWLGNQTEFSYAISGALDRSWTGTPDVEPNETPQTAIPLGPNTMATGNVGSRGLTDKTTEASNGMDVFDLYRFTVISRAEVELHLKSIDQRLGASIQGLTDNTDVPGYNRLNVGSGETIGGDGTRTWVLEPGEYKIHIGERIDTGKWFTAYEVSYRVLSGSVAGAPSGQQAQEPPPPAVDEPKTGYYYNDEYDSYVKINADKTAELSMNFGEAIIPFPAVWTTEYSSHDVVVIFTVTNKPQGWVVEDRHYFVLSEDRNRLSFNDRPLDSIGILPYNSNFQYIGTSPPTPPTPPPSGSSLPNNMSSWAIPEVENAHEMGLIPDSLLNPNVDYTRPITRAEFAAVSVKVYESLSGIPAIPALNNPFTDTNDVEVLKAYNVGITTGTSTTTFSPNTLLNREQAATMLTRVFKKVTLAGWTLQTDAQFTLPFNMPARFADDAQISGYARDSVYFMAANGIIGGIGNNMFAPRAVTTEEQARGYASATREQALAIAVRMVENLPAAPAPAAPVSPNASMALAAIADIPYFGDRSKCRMTADMARIYAEKVREASGAASDNYGRIIPALVDAAGDGIPLLLLIPTRGDNNMPIFSYRFFGFSNGSINEYTALGNISITITDEEPMVCTYRDFSDAGGEYVELAFYHAANGALVPIEDWQITYWSDVDLEGGNLSSYYINGVEVNKDLYNQAANILRLVNEESTFLVRAHHSSFFLIEGDPLYEYLNKPIPRSDVVRMLLDYAVYAVN